MLVNRVTGDLRLEVAGLSSHPCLALAEVTVSDEIKQRRDVSRALGRHKTAERSWQGVVSLAIAAEQSAFYRVPADRMLASRFVPRFSAFD